MADLVRLAFYPFLSDVKDVVKELGPEPDELLAAKTYGDARRRAERRVRRSLGKELFDQPTVGNDHDALTELLSHAVSKMILVCLGDRILASRYASKEAARVRRSLKNESDDWLLHVADELTIPIDSSATPWRMHFSDVLKHAPARKDWKLVLRTLKDGWVDLDNRDVGSLCDEALRRRIENELHDAMKSPPPTDLLAMLEPVLAGLRGDLDEARKDWNTGDFGPVKEGAFPPCINELFAAMKRQEMVPHHGRFAFASFLGTIGMSADQILDYMTQLPNFNRDKSEYQIRHIAGELGVDAYTPPSCATMQTNGVCPLDKRDEICGRIKHPLSYYRIKHKRTADAVVDKTTKANGKQKQEAAQ